MRYRTYGNYTRGYSHEKRGAGAEDYASFFADPEGRYQIAVICDGHSDKNCFRSARGARYGCESAVEQLSKFFDLYCRQTGEGRVLPEGTVERLKKSIKICWDRKVADDLQKEPMTSEELEPLSERVRNIYLEGKSLSSIYGTTFLAVAVCDDFFLALHIGDGIILAADAEGVFYRPLPEDPKGETGSPASLCDTDLFARENAFRAILTKKIPLIATVSSDGIEDCMDEMTYKRLTESFFRVLSEKEQPGQLWAEPNEEQKKYWQQLLEYYAKKGNGAEDDCSLAAIWDPEQAVPALKLTAGEVVSLWNHVINSRNDVVREYTERKKNLVMNISTLLYGRKPEELKKLEELRQVLGVVTENEKKKLDWYDRQLSSYEKYIQDSGADRALLNSAIAPYFVDSKYYCPEGTQQDAVRTEKTESSEEAVIPQFLRDQAGKRLKEFLISWLF